MTQPFAGKPRCLFLILLSIVTLMSFTLRKNPVLQPDKLLFSYVSYEYGQPLQKKPDDFGIRRIYEVYDTKEVKVIDKLYDGYEITTHLKIDDRFYQQLLKLVNLKSLRVSDKLPEGEHFAGAYDYIAVKHDGVNEELCFIMPLVSDKLKSLIDSFYRIKLKAGQQKVIKETPAEVNRYKEKIIPVHKVSNLPLIELPPPSM